MVDYQLMCTDGPVRICAACRTRRPQGALMRVARHPQHGVTVDDGRCHRAPGRGVYLCRSVRCVEMAAQRQSLRRALGVEVAASVYAELRRLVTLECSEAE